MTDETARSAKDRVIGDGIKRVRHPIVGDLDLTYLGLDLSSDHQLTMLIYSAEPDSASHDGLQLLGNWVAAHNPIAHAENPLPREQE